MKLTNPETGPIPETVEMMRKHDQSTPFFMMNLNKYYSKARYKNGEDVPGEQAYNCYASRIMPYLISVRGYPSIIGTTTGVFVGDESGQLHDDWSDFAMVYYTSRRNFIRMMRAILPQKAFITVRLASSARYLCRARVTQLKGAVRQTRL